MVAFINTAVRVVGASTSIHKDFLPVYVETGTKQEIMKNDESLLDQLRGDRCRIPIRINIEQRDDRTIISNGYTGGIPLHTPRVIPENLDSLQGNVHTGGFTILSNSEGQLLFVKKKRDQFWSIPGGLIEKGKDKTLWDAAKRELQEETGADLEDLVREPVFAYESFIPLDKPRRHNIMVFFSAHYTKDKSALGSIKDTDEIEKCAWISPAIFLSTYLKNDKFSKPMILLPLEEFRKTELVRLLDSETYDQYQTDKSGKLEDQNELLFDLCFIEVIRNSTEKQDLSIFLDETKNLLTMNRVYMEE